MSSFDISVEDPQFIKGDIYKLWLQGIPADAAARTISAREPERKFPLSLWLAEVADQFRAFVLLEHFLQQPKYFPGQCLFPLSSSMRDALIEGYYEFDENLVRDLLGKKLSTRTKKDIDEICERINISLKSGRRQFDNMKRIYKTVEDLDGSLYDNIQKHFLLPRKMSETYAHITFLSSNRIECSKKKLQHLKLQDFCDFAREMMSEWTHGDPSQEDDLDRQLIHDLRTIKFQLNADGDTLEDFKRLNHKVFIENVENGKEKFAKISGSFVPILRNVLVIGSGLSQSKEFRDIFIDIYERVVEPFKGVRANTSDVDDFFRVLMEVYTLCADSKSPLSRTFLFLGSFRRFINVIRKISVQIY